MFFVYFIIVGIRKIGKEAKNRQVYRFTINLEVKPV